MDDVIYLDHAATTPLRPEALEAMLPFLTANWANPSSPYEPGRQARAGLEQTRETVAHCLGAVPQEIVFTSGGSEADNQALIGAVLARPSGRRHIVTTVIEHHAVLHTCRYLEERHGLDVTYLPVDRTGLVDPGAVLAALRPETALVSVMLSNNEVGTIEPVADIARLVRPRCVLLHTDAVQAVGAIPVDVEALGVDLLSLSAHKFGGPRGVGALYVRRGTTLDPLVHGGSQESGLRAGTENVAGAVGMATALDLATQELPGSQAHCRSLRDELIERVVAQVPGTILNGHSERRLPNNASFCFADVEGEPILIELDAAGICASAGSACSAGSTEPSHVLVALGVPPNYLRGALRLTVGRENTAEQIDLVADELVRIVADLRALAA